MSTANTAAKMMEKNVIVRWEFIEPLGFMDIRTSFPQESGRTRLNSLLESTAMPQRKLFRFLLFAVLGLIDGFLALAIAVPVEQQIPAALIALFSPGLKLAELLTPGTGKSFAWTFGWFLRIAIFTNTVFYFAIFSLFVYMVDRRRHR